ncbi:MAG: tetratricopeptide repeat protein [Thermoanaerobaculia bacterium]
MKKRLVIGSVGLLLLLAVGAAAALYLVNRREVTTSSDQAYRAYQKAIENERRYYFKEAREGFAKALELDPQFAEAMLGLARLTEGEQGFALVRRAAKQRERLTERERLHVDLQLAGREGKLAERLKIAQQIHEKYPEDIRAAMMLCHWEIQNGNAERALQILSELLAIEPNNADAYNLIGYNYAYRGDYEKAIENIRKYQFMAPDQANPYDSLGEIQAYSGHYDEAIQNLNQALKLKPDFFASYSHLGVAYEGKGDYKKAVESYLAGAEEAYEDDMRREHLLAAMRAAINAKDEATARDLIARIQAIPKDQYAEIRTPVSQAILRLFDRKPAEAERLLREVRPKFEAAFAKQTKGTNLKPYDPVWNYLVVLSLMGQGKTEEALPLLEEMANPPNPWGNFEGRRWVYEGRALLAEQLARKGDLDRAEKLIAENRKWNPSWAPTRPSEQVVAQLRREKVLAAAH